MKKIIALEFKNFWNDPIFWPDETHTEEVFVMVNEKSLFYEVSIEDAKDTDSIVIKNGFVLDSPLYKSGKTPSLLSYFRKWQKMQTTVSFLVGCDRALFEAVKAAVLAAGGKIQG